MKEGRLTCLKRSMAREPVKAKPRFARCCAALTEPLSHAGVESGRRRGNGLQPLTKEYLIKGYLHKILDRPRDYDKKTARWVSKDPILFHGAINLYSYVSNDPINVVDFWGLVDVIMVGRNIRNPSRFTSIANKLAGPDTVVVQVRNIDDVNKALNTPNISNLMYIRHAGKYALFLSEDELTSDDVNCFASDGIGQIPLIG